ncbi:YolD-like family protein [Aeromonas sobria]|uniref:YolD-like family protein n=1 Tax=Aeromonas sobria TaxID=646 RepID=UPI00111B2525|nr:YolD-like family protein [Aeromonas sobria]TNH93895.1 hypothetical protein CF137_14245 [Aeromonas sobria]
METCYTNKDGDKLTFYFSEKLEANQFNLVYNNRVTTSGYRRDSETKDIRLSGKFFVLTLQDEPSAAELNQALQSAIKNQQPVEITVFRNHEEAHKLYVVVKESEPKQANGYRLNVVAA